MSSKDADLPLFEAALRLRVMQPQLWDDFVAQTRAYATRQTMAMLNAPPEALSMAQGMAKALDTLADKLATAEARHAAMMKGKQ